MDDLVTFLQASGADGFAHARGRTLLDHLIGTRDILARWRQPEWVQRAALMHSVYGTDSYQRQLFGLAQRAELSAIAGERAEQLAYLFCTVPRQRLFDEGASHAAPLDRTEIDELIVLHMANLAEQARAKDHSPGSWLTRVAKLGKTLAGERMEAPRALAQRLSPLTVEDEETIRNAYRVSLTELGDPTGGAERRLAQAAVACPVVPEPCLWLAYISLRREDWASAEWWTAKGRERLQQLGTTWDKRLDYERWTAVADLLQSRAQTRSPLGEGVLLDPSTLLRALADGRRPPARAAIAVTDGAGGERSEIDPGRARFDRYIDTFVHAGGDRLRRHYPGLESRPWHDPADFPLAQYLETNFQAIRAEILALDPAEFHPEAEAIERTGNWDVLFFYDRGRRIQENCNACPVLLQGIDTHPAMRTIAGLIYVSRLRAGTHIASHRGPTNFRLRCHLGIEVPQGDCAIGVAGEIRSWQEGRCLVLDDHFEHEAWNHTEQDRLVLVVDLWHPGLTPGEVQLLEGLHRYANRYARRQHRWWLRNYPEDRSPVAP
jgi:Aspartyl/Asparaginyl beta-hydroxylase